MVKIGIWTTPEEEERLKNKQRVDAEQQQLASALPAPTVPQPTERQRFEEALGPINDAMRITQSEWEGDSYPHEEEYPPRERRLTEPEAQQAPNLPPHVIGAPPALRDPEQGRFIGVGPGPSEGVTPPSLNIDTGEPLPNLPPVQPPLPEEGGGWAGGTRENPWGEEPPSPNPNDYGRPEEPALKPSLNLSERAKFEQAVGGGWAPNQPSESARFRQATGEVAPQSERAKFEAAVRPIQQQQEIKERPAARPLGTGRYSPYDDLWRKYAGDLASDDTFIAVVSAAAKAESGFNPARIGDNGHSVGLFQMHDQGAGAGMSVQQRMDPEEQAKAMVPRFAAQYKRITSQRPELSGADLASEVARYAERPRDYENPNSLAGVNYRKAWTAVTGEPLKSYVNENRVQDLGTELGKIPEAMRSSDIGFATDVPVVSGIVKGAANLPVVSGAFRGASQASDIFQRALAQQISNLGGSLYNATMHDPVLRRIHDEQGPDAAWNYWWEKAIDEEPNPVKRAAMTMAKGISEQSVALGSPFVASKVFSASELPAVARGIAGSIAGGIDIATSGPFAPLAVAQYAGPVRAAVRGARGGAPGIVRSAGEIPDVMQSVGREGRASVDEGYSGYSDFGKAPGSMNAGTTEAAAEGAKLVSLKVPSPAAARHAIERLRNSDHDTYGVELALEDYANTKLSAFDGDKAAFADFKEKAWDDLVRDITNLPKINETTGLRNVFRAVDRGISRGDPIGLAERLVRELRDNNLDPSKIEEAIADLSAARYGNEGVNQALLRLETVINDAKQEFESTPPPPEKPPTAEGAAPEPDDLAARLEQTRQRLAAGENIEDINRETSASLSAKSATGTPPGPGNLGSDLEQLVSSLANPTGEELHPLHQEHREAIVRGVIRRIQEGGAAAVIDLHQALPELHAIKNDIPAAEKWMHDHVPEAEGFLTRRAILKTGESRKTDIRGDEIQSIARRIQTTMDEVLKRGLNIPPEGPVGPEGPRKGPPEGPRKGPPEGPIGPEDEGETGGLNPKVKINVPSKPFPGQRPLEGMHPHIEGREPLYQVGASGRVEPIEFPPHEPPAHEGLDVGARQRELTPPEALEPAAPVHDIGAPLQERFEPGPLRRIAGGIKDFYWHGALHGFEEYPRLRRAFAVLNDSDPQNPNAANPSVEAYRAAHFEVGKALAEAANLPTAGIVKALSIEENVKLAETLQRGLDNTVIALQGRKLGSRGLIDRIAKNGLSPQDVITQQKLDELADSLTRNLMEWQQRENKASYAGGKAAEHRGGELLDYVRVENAPLLADTINRIRDVTEELRVGSRIAPPDVASLLDNLREVAANYEGTRREFSSRVNVARTMGLLRKPTGEGPSELRKLDRILANHDEIVDALPFTDWADNGAVVNFNRILSKENTWGARVNKYMDFRSGSLLSSTATLLTNVFGNAPEVVLGFPKDVLISHALGATWKESWADALAEYTVALSSARQAVMDAKHTMETGISNGHYRDLGRQIANFDTRPFQQVVKDAWKPNSATEIIFRLMAAGDDIYRVPHFNGLMMLEAQREARKLGTTPQDILTNLWSHPEVFDRAEAGALKRVFQAPLEGGFWGWVSHSRTMPIMREFIPFIHTLANMSKMAAETFPASEAWRLARTSDPLERAEHIANIQLYSPIYGGLIALAVGGLITGFGPPEGRDRDAWLETHAPFSVRTPTGWVPLEVFGRIGIAAGYLATVIDSMRSGGLKYAKDDQLDQAAADAIQSAIAGTGRFMLSTGGLRGLNDLWSSVFLGQWDRLFQGLALSHGPFVGLTTSLTKSLDDVPRNPDSMGDAIRARYLLSKDVLGMEALPVARTRWGEQISTTLGPAAMTPAVRMRGVLEDPVRKEIERLQNKGFEVAPGFVGGNFTPIKGATIKLTGAEQSDLQLLAGRMSQERLSGMIASLSWAAMPDSAKAKIITMIVDKSREYAHRILMVEHPNVLQRGLDERQKQISNLYR